MPPVLRLAALCFLASASVALLIAFSPSDPGDAGSPSPTAPTPERSY